MNETKVVLITGAAQRIGAAIARCLHGVGMNVAVHYRHSAEAAQALADELNTARPDSARLFTADLLDIAAITALVTQTLAAWGRLDALVNNASSFYPTPLGDITLAQWDDLIGSNLRAPLFLSQACAPHLTATQGCIVNIVDIHAERPLKHHAVYCAAKAGLVMLTKALARDLGPAVRVNAIAPGAILWPDAGLTPAAQQHIIDRTALKRPGNPQDIALAARYLIHDAAYTTGQVLAVDGGRSLSN